MVSCKRKEYLYNLTKIDPKNEQFKLKYRNYCNILGKVIVDAKSLHDQCEVEKVVADKPKLWDFVNQKLRKGPKKVNYIKYLLDNKTIKIENPSDIENLFNDFFIVTLE